MKCRDCGGVGAYWTEWSDAVNGIPEYENLIIERPIEPDGTVYIKCPTCNGAGETSE